MTDSLTPPISPENAVVTHVRGIGIRAFRATILASLLPEQLELLKGQVSSEAADLLRNLPPGMEWVDVRIVAELRQTYTRLFYYDSGRVRGDTIAELIFTDPRFAVLQGSREAKAFIGAMPLIWVSFHKGGLLQIDGMEPGSAWATIWASFPYPEYLAETVSETIKESMRFIGVEDASVEYHAPSEAMPHRHRYHMTWKA